MALRFAMPPEYDDELLRHQHSSSDDETQIELPEMLAWTRRNLSYATVATTLLIGCGVAALAVASLPVRTVAQQGHTVSSEVGRTLWISNAEIAHGFQLHAVHTHRLHPDGHVTHARHPVQSRQATRRLQTLVQEIGNLTSPRQEVRLLVALSSAAYGPLHGYSEEAYKPVLAASDSVFGADVSTYAEELNRTRAWQEELTSQVEALGDTHVNTALDIDASHKDTIGVHAYEFQRDGYGRVLVFRGSYSDGDYNNIIKWITKWVARRGDYQLKHQWIDLAGFSWSDVPKAGTVYNVGSKLDHYGFIYGAGKQSSEFMKKLQELAKAQGMDPAEVGELAKTGYWELTKKITSSAHNDWTNSSQPGVFRITGHSQGGTRVGLTSPRSATDKLMPSGVIVPRKMPSNAAGVAMAGVGVCATLSVSRSAFAVISQPSQAGESTHTRKLRASPSSQASHTSAGSAEAVALGVFAGLAVTGVSHRRLSKRRSHSSVVMQATGTVTKKEFGDGYTYDEADLLGSGAYGKVYLCKDKEGTERAVKQVFSGDFTALNREIEVYTHIGKHPNIVELVEAIDVPGVNDKMIVMEIARGGELSELIEEHGKLSEEKTQYIFKQLVSAITHMHDQNVLHRDLKTDNVLLCTDTEHDSEHPFVKLIDFGAAHWEREGPLQASKYIGSIQTIAPEVIIARGDDFNAGDDSQVAETHVVEYKKRPFGIRKYKPGPEHKGAKVMLVGDKPRYPGDPIGQANSAGVQVGWVVKSVNGVEVSDMDHDDILDTMGDRLLDNSSRGAFDGSFKVTGNNKGNGKVLPKVEMVELPVSVVYAQMKPKPYDGKADVWSLGSVLYQMATGTAPFEPSEESVMEGKYKDPEGVSAELIDLLSKMLVVDPKQRASFADVAAHPWVQ